MILLGLIGHPLGHSLSPRLHNAALRACNLQGQYSLFPIEPDNVQVLSEILSRVRSGEITGLNVTIPHKQNVIPLLDELTETAEAIGAVNTIYLRKKRLLGDNTDAPGFWADLKKFLGTESSFHKAQPRLRHEGSRALVLGAGGSARAVVYALVNHGWNVSIAARRTEQGQQLADSFTGYKHGHRTPEQECPERTLPGTARHDSLRSKAEREGRCAPGASAGGSRGVQVLPITNLRLSSLELSTISLIVNTTPVGMAPKIDRSPWPENLPLPRQAVIYDLVYNPSETKFVKDARLQGLSATNGFGMLVEQAALSFELWTGQKPSRDVMFDAANQTAH